MDSNYCGIARFMLLLHASCHLAHVVWPIYCHMIVQLTLVSFSLPSTSSPDLASQNTLWVSLGSGKKVRDTPCMTFAPIWDLPGLSQCHFSTHLRGATRHRSSLDVARKLLGHLGRILQDSQKLVALTVNGLVPAAV